LGDWIAISSTANSDTTETDIAETDTVKSDAAAANDINGFQLVEVRPRYVTLQRKGQKFRLELNDRTGVDRKIRIQSAKP
jgi:hypothetical protein